MAMAGSEPDDRGVRDAQRARARARAIRFYPSKEGVGCTLLPQQWMSKMGALSAGEYFSRGGASARPLLPLQIT